MNRAPVTANATFCATLIDQLVNEGLTQVFIAPGSRSTPLALAALHHSDIAIELCHDERVAAFAALGFGQMTGRPAMVLCSSGTAGAHFYGAVIEADVGAVPLIVCTADRPPELWDRGAPQTIDQTELYGTRVRRFVEPGPPEDTDPASWRTVAQEIWSSALGTPPGPVHANLSFREPLTGWPGVLSPPLAPWSEPASPPVATETIEALTSHVGRRGVIVAGRSETDPAEILRLASVLDWPLIADHRSGCRDPGSPLALRHFDSLLRAEDFTSNHQPDVVVRIGEIVSSKAVSQWLSKTDATILASRPHQRHIDPENIADYQFDERGVVEAVLDKLSEQPAVDQPAGWSDSWTSADQCAVRAIDQALQDRAGESPTEVEVARSTVRDVPAGSALVVASSMPVRDVEWFAPNRSDIAVIANRGANGIDGTISTAIGVASTGVATTCLIGDVALLHDATALIALHARSIDLTIVVINNDGGGIFSFLPQHELLDRETYEVLFGTPHGTDLNALANAHGIPFTAWPASLDPAGVRIVEASSNRDQNLALHAELHQAVAGSIAR